MQKWTACRRIVTTAEKEEASAITAASRSLFHFCTLLTEVAPFLMDWATSQSHLAPNALLPQPPLLFMSTFSSGPHDTVVKLHLMPCEVSPLVLVPLRAGLGAIWPIQLNWAPLLRRSSVQLPLLQHGIVHVEVQ